jgi:hypothetical protein
MKTGDASPVEAIDPRPSSLVPRTPIEPRALTVAEQPPQPLAWLHRADTLVNAQLIGPSDNDFRRVVDRDHRRSSTQISQTVPPG